MLGLIFGAGLGISSYTLLGTWKIHKFRTRLITALTFVTWIGAFSLLIQMNPDSFMRYLTSHLNAYELRMFSSEFVHVPFVRQLPNTLGSTILTQLSLPWAEITVPHPVERLLFLIVPFHYPPITLGMFIFVLLPHLVLVLLFGRDGVAGFVTSATRPKLLPQGEKIGGGFRDSETSLEQMMEEFSLMVLRKKSGTSNIYSWCCYFFQVFFLG